MRYWKSYVGPWVALFVGCASGTDGDAVVANLTLDREDEGRLQLNGSPIDPQYTATYPNPREVARMIVDVESSGDLESRCFANENTAACSDPPFFSRMEVRGGMKVLTVRDMHGEMIFEEDVGRVKAPVRSTPEDGEFGTAPSPDEGSDRDSTTPDGSDDGPDGSRESGGGHDDSSDSGEDRDGSGEFGDGGGGSGDSCPEILASTKPRYCEEINTRLDEFGIEEDYDCADLSDSPSFGDDWDFPNPDAEPGCDDIVEVPAEDIEDEWDDSEVEDRCPTLEVTLSNWETDARHDLMSRGVCGISPLVLDVEGDGLEFTSVEAGVQFDLVGTGEPIQSAWLGGDDDAFVVLDRNDNGSVDGGAELFGNATAGGRYANGFDALAALDADDDGRIDQGDPAFRELRLWSDPDRDGVGTEDELVTLAQAGVTALPLASRERHGAEARDTHGNYLALTSSAVWEDGSHRRLVDVFLRFEDASARKASTVSSGTPSVDYCAERSLPLSRGSIR